MTKEELIFTTLKQLNVNFKTSPENFRLEDAQIAPTNGTFYGPTIVWQFKVKLKEGQYIPDPLNATRTIMICYNKVSNQLSCLIYFREVTSMSLPVTPDTQAMIQCSHFPILNRTYRQFMKIRKQLIKLRNEREFIDYMRKLNNIFPATHEDDLFK